MHSYLEFVDAKSSKFWEVTVADATMTTRWGRIGAAGQTKQQSFDSPALATAAAEKLQAEKLKKGYVAADGAEADDAEPVAERATETEAATEPGTEPAGGPEPGPAAGAGSAPKVRAADSKLLAEIDRLWDRIEAKYEELGATEALLGPATEADIAAAEAKLEVAFPAPLRHSLGRHNGSKMGGWPAGDLLGTTEIVSETEVWRELLASGDFDDAADYHEDERLQPGWWHVGWICIDADGGGNGAAVDVQPAATGKVGQVLGMDHEVGPEGVHHDDLAGYLREQLRLLRTATFEDGYLEIDYDLEEWVTYLEFVDEKSSKFWEVTVDGEAVTTRWGRIGAAGQTKEQEFDSEDDAIAAAEKLIDEKLGKGYTEAEPPAAD